MKSLSNSPRTFPALIGAATVVLMLLVAFVPLRIAVFANDGLTVLEGSWRLHQGMRIHTDWHAPIGPFYYFILNLGLDVAGVSHRAFGIAAAIMLPFVVAVSSFVFRRRLGSTQTLVLLAIQVAAIVGVFCLGTPEMGHATELRTPTWGMQYNRFLWPPAIVAILGLLLPTRESEKSRSSETVDALLIGACVGILFFGKINYLIAAVPIIAYGAWRRGARWSLSAGVGILIVAATFVLLKVSIRDYVQDLRDLAGAQGLLQRITSVAARVGDSMDLLILLAIGFGYGVRITRHAPQARPYLWSVPVLAAYGIVVASTNFQNADIPTMGVAAVMLLEAVRVARASEEDGQDQTPPIGWTALAYGIAGTFVVLNFGSLLYAYVAEAVRHHPLIAADPVPVFDDIADYPLSEPYLLYRDTKDEAELASRYVKPDEPISSLTWFNILPVATGRRSPSGLLWYHDGKTVTRKTMPSPDREFATTAGVMVKRGPDRMIEMDKIVIETYTPYLRSHFVEVAHSKYWTLWLRPDLAAQRSGGLRPRSAATENGISSAG